MAKDNTTRKINISANGKSAEEVFERLSKKMNAAKKAMDALRAAGKANSQEFKALKGVVNAFEKDLKNNETELHKVEKVMANLGGATTRQLRSALREVKKEMENVSAESGKLPKLREQFKQIQQQIDKNTGSFKKQEGTITSLIKHGAQMVAMYASFNALKSTLTSIIQKNLEFSDQLANIRKVSGLTNDSIANLSNNIMKIQTRTSVSELNQLAYVGAKLGVAAKYGEDGLLGFVKASDKLNVALKEDMGDDAITQISKMTQVMGDMDKMGVEKSLLATSSAIFKLSSTTTSNGANITAFSKRLVGLAKASNMTTPEILALGSAADSMMLMPEVASTAMSKFITSLQTNYNLMENDLHMKQGELKNIIENEGIMPAILEVLKRMKEEGGMNALNFMFKDMGSDGARLKNVLVTMSQNYDILASHLKTANEAFKEGTAVTVEYLIQQDTANAYMEKAGNLWANFAANASNADGPIKELAKSIYEFSKMMTENSFSLGLLSTALASIVKLVGMLLVSFPQIVILIGSSYLNSIGAAAKGTNLWATAIAGVQAGWGKLMTVLKQNALGMILVSIYNVVRIISSLSDAENEATERAQKMADAQAQVNEQSDKEIKNLTKLYNAIRDTKKPLAERKALLDTFNTTYGDYLSNQVTDINNTIDLAKAYEEAAKKVRLYYRAKELETLKDELVTTPKTESEADLIKAKGLDANLKGLSIDNFTQLVSMAMHQTDANGNKQFKDANDIARWIMEDNPYGVVGGKSHYDRAGVSAFGQQFSFSFQNKDKNASDVMTKAVEKMMTSMEGEIGLEEDPYWREAMKFVSDEENNPLKLTNLARNKAAEAAARKENQERIKAKKQELKAAEADYNAVMSNIDEYYNLQEAAVNQLLADGKVTKAESELVLADLERRRNKVAEQARLAISGQNNTFEELRQNGMGSGIDQVDFGERSNRALSDIRSANPANIFAVLSKYSGNDPDNVNGGEALLDEVKKKSAENTKAIAESNAKARMEILNLVQSYDLVQETISTYASNFTKMGLLSEGNEVFFRRMRDKNTPAAQAGTNAETAGAGEIAKELDLPEVAVSGYAGKYVSPFERMLKQFIDNGTKPYEVNPNDEDSLAQWLSDFATNYQGADKNGNLQLTGWASVFPDIQTWLDDTDEHKADIQAFYYSLIQYEDDYYRALSKSAERDKTIQEERWGRSPMKARLDMLEQQYSLQQKIEKTYGTDKGSMWQQQGFADSIADDPEVKMYEVRLQKAQEYYEQCMKMAKDQKTIDDARQARDEAYLNLGSAISNQVKQRMELLHKWTAPMEEFGTAAGEAFSTMIDDAEAGKDALKEATKTMIKSFGQLTVKMITEMLTQKLQQALIHKEMEAEDARHSATKIALTETTETGLTAIEATEGQTRVTQNATTNAAEVSSDAAKTGAEVPLGIASGAAKTLGSLGWWGIPLIAVITAALNALLSFAMGRVNALFGGSSSSNTNTKLVSGMLTYDSGNVQSYAGTDGHTYSATQVSSLSTGLVTSPIATTVNGVPSLVGEKGPEIVVGRETTAAIQRNDPGLLRMLVGYDKLYSGRRLRTLDSGDMSAISSVSGSESAGGTDMSSLMTAILYRLENPIAPEISMYGRNGLHDKLQRANTFMRNKS